MAEVITDSSKCPACGNSFSSEHGMKIHYASCDEAEYDSLSGTKTTCDECGNTFRRAKSMIKRTDKSFCGEKCQSTYLSDYWQGETQPTEDKEYADKELLKQRYKDNYESAHQISLDFDVKEDAIRYWLKKYNIEVRDSDDYGHDSEWRGPSWDSQREKTLERDNYECVDCGMTDSEHRQKIGGGGLHVHHKTPFHVYGRENHKEANRLDNLVSVCNYCHQEREDRIRMNANNEIKDSTGFEQSRNMEEI